jgi:hypothetical protein
VCDQRTLRRVNPAVLETGTTFVQCRRVRWRGAPGSVQRLFARAAVFRPPRLAP